MINNYCHTMPQQGWECPKCHAVMAANTPTCFYCKPIEKRSFCSFCKTETPNPHVCSVTGALVSVEFPNDYK